MKFISYCAKGGTGIALDVDGAYRGLVEGQAHFPGTVTELVLAGRAAFHDAADALRRHGGRVDASDIELQPPLDPDKIICVGLNYVDHAQEASLPIPATPPLFSRFSSSIVASGALIVLPRVSRELDFEGELAVVIGKSGRDIHVEEALAYVAGYSCFNDGTLRDYQFRTPQWMIGKNFDRSGSFGPGLVTVDSLPPGASGLAIQTRLNGEIVQSSSTDQMIFGVAKLIALFSEALTLKPGDVIATGTPAGVGFARKPPLWMKEGDICEVEIKGIGTLCNRVTSEL